MVLRKAFLQCEFLFRNVDIYHINPRCWYSSRISNTFKFSDLSVRLAAPHQLRPKPEAKTLQFGKYFTDHMLRVYYYETMGGWQKPEIIPMENLVLHPAAKVLHYAMELFEGMKAYRGIDDRIRLYRPELNMLRMNRSAFRSSLPMFDSEQLIKCLCRLITVDQEWVPHSESSSLYIRPTLIGIDPQLGVASCSSAMLFVILCPVGSYFANDAINLFADPSYVRAWPGGCGDRKMGSNYGPTIAVQEEASKKGLHQVLWLFGENHLITEVGTMNIFMVYLNEMGERELVTPPLDGLILPGIVRQSILELSHEWNRFKVTERSIPMGEIIQLLNENRLLELFGAGTACVVSPVASIHYMDLELKIPTMEQPDPIFAAMRKAMYDIQYGHIRHPWALCIDEYEEWQSGVEVSQSSVKQ